MVCLCTLDHPIIYSLSVGGVVHVSAFGQPLIILNSTKAITDLLEKRSGIYSDRPTLPMAGEMCVSVEFSL